jgi:hypothetical protein
LAARSAADHASASAACVDYSYDECRAIFAGVGVSVRREQALLLRDIVGDPFRPVAVDPSWRSGHGGRVSRMARSIYEARRFGDLSLLADALEDAGCAVPEIFAHCRHPDSHVRGCWVIDLLLERS